MTAMTLTTVQTVAAGPAQAVATTTVTATTPPVSLILDTDVDDVDDVGAVGLLNIMADRGQVRLLSMMVNTPGQYGASAVSALNTYYYRPDIPIGTVKPTTSGTQSPYNQQLSNGFPHPLASGYDAPDATTLYRQLLPGEPDNSVTIASVGLLTNLRICWPPARPPARSTDTT